MLSAKRVLAGIAFVAVRSYLRYSPIRVGQKRAWEFARAYLAHYDFRRLARTNAGSTIDCSSDDLVQSVILYFGEWEPALTQFLSTRLKLTDVFVDVGANVGYFTLLASRIVGRFGTVVAIEASATNYAALRENLFRNKVGNVRVVHAAVMERRGLLVTFTGGPGNAGHASVLPEHGTEVEGEVEAFPLPEVLTEREWESARVIKIDVEGAESDVLRGILAGPDLAQHTELVVEINPDWLSARGDSAGALLRAFRDRGYYVYELDRSFPWEHRTGPLLSVVQREPSRVADIVLSRVPDLHTLF